MEGSIRNLKRLRSRALLLSALIVLAPQLANATTLNEAKSAGQIGEGVDGYVHLVEQNAPADVKALVSNVNTQRKEKYASIAATRGVPLEDVAALAGAKLVERAGAGEYVLDSSGSWRKK